MNHIRFSLMNYSSIIHNLIGSSKPVSTLDISYYDTQQFYFDTIMENLHKVKVYSNQFMTFKSKTNYFVMNRITNEHNSRFVVSPLID